MRRSSGLRWRSEEHALGELVVASAARAAEVSAHWSSPAGRFALRAYGGYDGDVPFGWLSLERDKDVVFSGKGMRWIAGRRGEAIAEFDGEYDGSSGCFACA